MSQIDLTKSENLAQVPATKAGQLDSPAEPSLEQIQKNEQEQSTKERSSPEQLNQDPKNTNATTLDAEKIAAAKRKEEFLANIASKYNIFGNSLAVLFHGSAAITQFFKIGSEDFRKKLDDITQKFARWVVPVGYIINGIKAWTGKRSIEALLRFSLPILKVKLPFFNLTMADAFHSGGYFFESQVQSVMKKTNKDLVFNGHGEYLKHWLSSAKTIFKDIFGEGKVFSKAAINTYCSIGMLGSSIIGMSFYADKFNGGLATFINSLRNIAGGTADVGLLLQRAENLMHGGASEFVKTWKEWKESYADADEKGLKQVGALCGTASVIGFFSRLLAKNPITINIVAQLQNLFDTAGFLRWGLESERLTNKANQAKKNQANGISQAATIPMAEELNSVNAVAEQAPASTSQPLPSLNEMRKRKQEQQSLLEQAKAAQQAVQTGTTLIQDQDAEPQLTWEELKAKYAKAS